MRSATGWIGFRATFRRELLSYRINRFLYVHLGLVAAIGMLALLSPPDDAARGAAWWVLNGVLYVGTLSAILLGLSSAQAESEEFSQLFTQPLTTRWWILGKTAGLAAVLVPASALLAIPSLLSGFTGSLVLGSVAAGGITVLFSWVGLLIGLTATDAVKGLIGAVAAWCVLLFGVDLLLMLLGGAEWVQRNPGPWVAALMASPLDAYRITVLFVLENAAFASADMHPLTRWWLENAAIWLLACIVAWCVIVWQLCVSAAERRRRT